MTYQHEARKSSTVWVLVADRARARLYAGEWPNFDGLEEIRHFAHPEGESHPRDVETDGPGTFQEPSGPRHGG